MLITSEVKYHTRNVLFSLDMFTHVSPPTGLTIVNGLLVQRVGSGVGVGVGK